MLTIGGLNKRLQYWSRKSMTERCILLLTARDQSNPVCGLARLGKGRPHSCAIDILYSISSSFLNWDLLSDRAMF